MDKTATKRDLRPELIRRGIMVSSEVIHLHSPEVLGALHPIIAVHDPQVVLHILAHRVVHRGIGKDIRHRGLAVIADRVPAASERVQRLLHFLKPIPADLHREDSLLKRRGLS